MAGFVSKDKILTRILIMPGRGAQIDYPGVMAGAVEKAQERGRGQSGRHGVLQRVIVDQIGCHHRLIENDLHLSSSIADSHFPNSILTQPQCAGRTIPPWSLGTSRKGNALDWRYVFIDHQLVMTRFR